MARISGDERRKMLQAVSIGPKMIGYLEEAGIEKLADLRGMDAHVLALAINAALGRRHINANGVRALENLIKLAEGGGLDDRPAASSLWQAR